MQIYDVATAKNTILRRGMWDEIDVSPSVQDRVDAIFGAGTTADEAVRLILRDVRARGDEALREWARHIDGVDLDAISAPANAAKEAYDLVDPGVAHAMRLAARRIEEFHSRQPSISWIHNDGEGTLGQVVRPIERIGVYTPGGTAPLPSSLLMTAIPAKVAGVSNVVVVTPPQGDTGLPHPLVLVAAEIAGVDAVYVSGGAQAIGALAFGTETIPAVDKICGPGNLFTTLAKRQVFGMVGIDGLPGPTETVVIADERADPQMVASDLLAQAEHDVLACAILLTPSVELAEQVQTAVLTQLEERSRQEIIAGSLDRGSGIVVTPSLNTCFELANEYAPEHLCLLVQDPWEYLGEVRSAGGVFLGERSFEVLGDYVAGPSHVMPTGGTARFASPVNVNDFLKIISVVGLNENALRHTGQAAMTLALAEGLDAHAAAVERRLSEGDE
jgi:histidinol dehydrogenase